MFIWNIILLLKYLLFDIKQKIWQKRNQLTGGGGGASTQSNSIDSKASVLSGYSLSTSVQTVVGAINEIQGKLGIVSYPENTTDDSSNVIRLGKDSPEVIKKKVFGGVPYVIIEPSETWNSEYYSNLLDEDGFHSWYENTIADNTCIYEIYNVLTIQTDEENGFGIAIRVLKPQPAPGPLAVVVNGPEVSTNPLDFIDMTCVFANNEESILSYELNAWRTTTSVIYTTPPESYPIREGSGYDSAIMGHYRNQANGDYSVAEGLDTIASRETSHAEGCSTQALGLGSHAEGYYTRAIGDYSHAEGSGTTASGNYSHAEGFKTSASGSCSHAEGGSTTASGDYSHAEGSGTTASGNYSHAEGSGTTASGNYSHAEGFNTSASGSCSHAEGYNALATGNCSHAEGNYTVASGIAAHAEGYSTEATANYSHAEGQSTTASGSCSHAEGFYNTASGSYSHAEGYHTEAFRSSEHAEGYYNKSYDSDDVSVRIIHSVGIGSSFVDRKNSHEIKFNGDHYIYGLGNFDGTNSDSAQTLQEVINSKQATITAGTGLEFEGNTLNVTLDTTVFYVVQMLPTTPAEGNENKICLVPTVNVSTLAPEIGTVATHNEYTEYIWVDNKWEELGKYYSEVDLTPYLKTVDAESTYLKITDAESSYQKITDDALNTTSKTIVGAINEILPKVTGVGKVDPNSNGTGEVFNVYEGSGATVASGDYSHAEGYRTIASGRCSHAEGSATNASGNYSHAEGISTNASGYYSHAEGDSTKATGHRSHAEGSSTTASGRYSHAEGYQTNATDEASHAEGNLTTAKGMYSHAEGWYTNASGRCAHAEGYDTQTFSTGEHAEGYYNKSYDSGDVLVSVIHSVGIGKSDDDRKNAHEIKLNGDHYIYGLGGYDGTNSDTAQTLQEVITGLQASTRTRQSEQTVYTEVPELTADYQIPANDTFVERVYIIPVGDTLYSVTGDSSILWAGGIAPNPSANSVLVVSIVKNLATWNVFMVS